MKPDTEDADVQSNKNHEAINLRVPAIRGLLTRIFLPRFSLRMLLIMTTVVGVGFGWFYRFDRIRRNIASLEAAGSTIVYFEKHEAFHQGVVEEWLRQRMPQCYFDKVQKVKISPSEDNDPDLSLLTEFSSLKELDLSDAKVSNAGLVKLKNFKKLETLFLDRTKVVDANLENLADMKSLRILSLRFTRVGDKGMHHLSSLKSLKELNLEGTRVSDIGLIYLTKLKALRSVNLRQTKVSRVGIGKLGMAIDCKISHSLKSDSRR